MAELSDSPIPPQVHYLSGLVVSLSVVSLSVLTLLNALGQGDKAQAWISAGYFVAASLLAALFFWWLFLVPPFVHRTSQNPLQPKFAK